MAIDPEKQSRYIFDPESAIEMARLIEQDQLATKAMGGVLAGLSTREINALHTVLDIACGPGGWVLDVAFEYPNIEVAGIDISHIMINYANARAYSQNLPNATFGEMDITKSLDFADASFDLVNARLLFGVLHRTAWEGFVKECTRILRPGGILRLTEPIDLGETNSPAQAKLVGLLTQTMWRIGYGFSFDGRTLGTAYMLPHLLRKAGYESIQYRPYTLDFSASSEAWASSYHNNELAFEAAKPLLIKLGLITQEEFEQQYQQMIIDMHGEDFCALGHCVTVWGFKSTKTADSASHSDRI